jgi:hypothetical protein
MAALREELAGAGAARDEAEARVAALREELAGAGAARDEAEARVAALEPEVDAGRSGRRAAEARARVLEADVQAARVARTAAEARAATLGADLEAARGALRPPPTPAGTAGDTRLAALWALAELAQRRAWRLSLATPDAAADGLGGALRMEVDRIREEVGTPGSLEAHLEPAVAADDATLALLAARELLATLAPHTEAYDMTVDRDGARLTISVVCTGWDGPSESADEVSRLLAAVAPAGADLRLDASAEGRLEATLELPLRG